MHKYEDFEAEDFLLDDYFIASMLRPTPSSLDFWETFRKSHPSRSDEYEKAVRLFRAVELNNDFLAEGELTAMKEKLAGELRPPHGRSRVFSRPWMRAAAAIAVLIMAAFTVYYLTLDRFVVIETLAGVTRDVTLPDASMVSLNGNSSLRYRKAFREEAAREVWLEGEAYFEVTESPDKKFIVHTAELDVEVLGTSFNVDDRESVTKVVLSSGRVKVHINDDQVQDNVFLRPGEMVEYQKESAALVKQVVDPDAYTLWKEDTLQFNHERVADIAEMLRERYGYRITIADPALGAKYFTGRFSSRNIDIVIAAMEKALGMEAVYRSRKEMVWKLNV